VARAVAELARRYGAPNGTPGAPPGHDTPGGAWRTVHEPRDTP
ncbi:transcriptional regulator, partial [Streptomyces sp. SID8361]